MYANEQKLLHEHFHGDNPASTTQVFLVNDLGIGGTGIGNVQGRANANPKPGGIEGLNTVSIDVNDAVPNVLVHELGHAIWSLLHPGGPGTPNQFGIDDLDNFMHGVSNEIKNWNVRRYQFGKMH